MVNAIRSLIVAVWFVGAARYQQFVSYLKVKIVVNYIQRSISDAQALYGLAGLISVDTNSNHKFPFWGLFHKRLNLSDSEEQKILAFFAFKGYLTDVPEFGARRIRVRWGSTARLVFQKPE